MPKRPTKRPPPRRVATDDFTFTQDGIDYQPHADEWVEIVPIVRAKDYRSLQRLSQMGDRLAISADDSAEQADVLTTEFEYIADVLANRIVRWNWTDIITGDELPQPHKQPEVISDLTTEEMMYLIGIMFGETPTDRKND